MSEKQKTLKQWEKYVYRVAYYMLEEKETAMEASVLTLLEAARHDEFFRMNPEGQSRFVRNLAIKKSLQVIGRMSSTA